jgi:short-chain fatty acids transporter
MIPYRFSFLFSFVMLYMAYRAFLLRRHFKPWQIIFSGILTLGIFACSESLTDPVFIAYNLIFLILGIIFNRTPIGYVRAINDAAKSAGGIILQFPFYAGIMGMMTFAGEGGTSLAGIISDFFVNVSNQVTFPFFTFLSAGIVNFFVPSGGGQWAVQAPIVMPAGKELGLSPAISGMAIAWGDAWTNMLQPFWALPALGIAGLGARDIMGYCAIDLIVSGIIVAIGFLVLVPIMA